MLKKTINYIDFNGEPRKEEFYFNLTRAEITEMELSLSGGMVQFIETIVATNDEPKMIELWKQILLRSYGEKSPDGRLFRKTPKIVEDFSYSAAYAALFMELASDAEAAAAFINGVVPQQ